MNMKVNLAGVELKNPVMTASGTFGSGAEYSESDTEMAERRYAEAGCV